MEDLNDNLRDISIGTPRRLHPIAEDAVKEEIRIQGKAQRLGERDPQSTEDDATEQAQSDSGGSPVNPNPSSPSDGYSGEDLIIGDPDQKTTQSERSYKADPQYRPMNSRMFLHVCVIQDAKNVIFATLDWENVTANTMYQ